MNRFQYPREAVTKAIQFLKTKKGKEPNFLKKFPGEFSVKQGKLYAGELRVIPTEERDDFLREAIYGKQSEYPFGRDSAFAIIKTEVLNVSKRDIEAFLNKQGPLVHRRSRPPKEKRVHLRKIRKPGILSMDLVHVKAADFVTTLGDEAHAYMGAPGKRGYQQDRFFVNAVDLLTGYLLTEVNPGKTAWQTWRKMQKIINRYETQFGIKVRQIEVDKGKEFFGHKGDPKKGIEPLNIMEELKERKEGPIRLIRKLTNAAVEQKNAHMQRVFWAIVAQRRGGFLTSVKQAVKISNRTKNRRTGLTPEEAMKRIAGGTKVSQKTPKAGPTERKKAFPVGTKVRALKKGRSKGDSLEYKAYKGQHYGAVTPIEKVKFMGVHPKYRVGARWVWGDELITARKEDTKAHNLIIKRPLVLPKNVVPLPKPKKIAPKLGKKGFYKGQAVWVKPKHPDYKGKTSAGTVVKVDGDAIDVRYYWAKDRKVYTATVAKAELRPQPVYEIEDRVHIWDGGKWHNGEVDAVNDNNKYRVFWTEDNKRWSRTVDAGLRLKPR